MKEMNGREATDKNHLSESRRWKRKAESDAKRKYAEERVNITKRIETAFRLTAANVCNVNVVSSVGEET